MIIVLWILLVLASIYIAILEDKLYWLKFENSILEKERDDAKMDERVVKSLMMVWKDKAQRLEKEIYGLSDNRCNECGQFLPKNQECLCEVCALAKGGDI